MSSEVKKATDTRADADERLTPARPIMRVIYIAGPYSGADGWEIACNVHRAEALAREVARLGAAPLVPHSIGARMAGTETYEYWCAATLEMMRRCDAVLFTDDFGRSSGARGEKAEAEKLGIPCFYAVEALKLWLCAETTIMGCVERAVVRRRAAT